MKMRIGCVDFVSNSFFPVLAAEELGFYKAEGLDAHVELVTGPRALPVRVTEPALTRRARVMKSGMPGGTMSARTLIRATG